jgi:hypothetical protein
MVWETELFHTQSHHILKTFLHPVSILPMSKLNSEGFSQSVRLSTSNSQAHAWGPSPIPVCAQGQQKSLTVHLNQVVGSLSTGLLVALRVGQV